MPNALGDPCEDDGDEDVSPGTVLARHQRSEELERLRFLAHQGSSGRHGASTRKRAMTGALGTSSAGSNTPGNAANTSVHYDLSKFANQSYCRSTLHLLFITQFIDINCFINFLLYEFSENPLSPHPDTIELGSPLATPPATPQPISEDANQSLQQHITSADGHTISHSDVTLAENRISFQAQEEADLTYAPDSLNKFTCTNNVLSDTQHPPSQSTSLVKHNSGAILISSPFLTNLQKTELPHSSNSSSPVTSSAIACNSPDTFTTDDKGQPLNIIDVVSCDGPNTDVVGGTKGVGGARKLRSSSAGSRLRSSSSGPASITHEDDINVIQVCNE